MRQILRPGHHEKRGDSEEDTSQTDTHNGRYQDGGLGELTAQIKTIVQNRQVITDPRPLTEQFPGLHQDDVYKVLREVQFNPNMTYEVAADLWIQRRRGKEQMDGIRAEMGNVLGDNPLGRSFFGKWLNRIRDSWLLLDLYDQHF
jgi:hypothetical protein